MRGHLFTAALALALVRPSFAQAEPSALDIGIARKLFADAEADQRGERWADALEKLTRVVATKETAGVRFHIARCEEHLGQLIAAERDYRRSIELALKLPAGEGDAVSDLASAALTSLGPKIPTLALHLPAAPGALRVSIDGQEVTTRDIGAPRRHDLGAAEIDVTAEGRIPFHRSLILLAGDHPVVEVDLPPVPTHSVTTFTPPAAKPTEGPQRQGRASSRLPAWVAAGTTLALGGAAVGFALAHRSLQSSTDALCADPTVVCDRTAREHRLSQYGTTSVALGVAGVVAMSTTVLLFAWIPRQDTQIAVGPAGVVTRLRF